MQQLFTTAEYADMYHVQPRTVRRWIETGKVQSKRNPAGRLMVVDNNTKNTFDISNINIDKLRLSIMLDCKKPERCEK